MSTRTLVFERIPRNRQCFLAVLKCAGVQCLLYSFVYASMNVWCLLVRDCELVANTVLVANVNSAIVSRTKIDTGISWRRYRQYRGLEPCTEPHRRSLRSTELFQLINELTRVVTYGNRASTPLPGKRFFLTFPITVVLSRRVIISHF